jgi:hypothetical protein
MPAIDTELHNLEGLYDRLEIGLEKQYQHLRLSDFPDAAEDIEAAQLAEQMQKAETQLAWLVRARDPDSKPSSPEGIGITARAAQLQKRAHHLLALIERNAAQCRELQRASQDALRELQVGGQFLQSVRGYRENQPRFLDARQ